jgi:hypothetical protein
LTEASLDDLRDESDMLLSLMVWHPGRNQEVFAMPKTTRKRRRTDNGLQWQSGQAAQVVSVPQPTWVTPKPSRKAPVGKSLLIRGPVDPGLYQADGDFLLKSMGIFFHALLGGFDKCCRLFAGP